MVALQPKISPALQMLQIQKLWDIGLEGTDQLIGHLDTGIDERHPALTGKIATFKTFNESDNLLENTPTDNGFHGTHIAGLLCGGEIEGIKIGMAPEAKLCAAQVLDTGKDILHTLLGLDWLRRAGIRVLCLPMGIKRYNPILQPMLQALRKAGILVICPIGNNGVRRYSYPGVDATVLTVGALLSKDEVASFSGTYWDFEKETCIKPEVIAPGVNILSADGQNGWKTLSGTSQACALVAGIATLLFQAFPKTSIEQVEQAIFNSCTPLSMHKARRCRYGIINPIKALDVLQ